MATSADAAAAMLEAMTNSPGVVEVQTDGLRAKIDPGELEHMERRAARESSPRTRPISASMDMSRCMP